jgi:hypothetical protein
MKPKHSLNHNIKSVPLVLTGNTLKELQRLFSDLPESENGYVWLDSVFMKIAGVADAQQFNRDDYIDEDWCYIEGSEIGAGNAEITLKSAWRAPILAIRKLSQYLGQFDSDLIVAVRYDDEGLPARFFGWATFLAVGLDEGEEFDEEQYFELACEHDSAVIAMEEDSDEFAAYIEEKYPDLYYDVTTTKLQNYVQYMKENNYDREEEETD